MALIYYVLSGGHRLVSSQAVVSPLPLIEDRASVQQTRIVAGFEEMSQVGLSLSAAVEFQKEVSTGQPRDSISADDEYHSAKGLALLVWWFQTALKPSLNSLAKNRACANLLEIKWKGNMALFICNTLPYIFVATQRYRDIDAFHWLVIAIKNFEPRAMPCLACALLSRRDGANDLQQKHAHKHRN